MSDEMESWYQDRGTDFEVCLLELAVTKVNIDPNFAPNIHNFNYKWTEQYKDWIDEVKNELFVKGIPIFLSSQRHVESAISGYRQTFTSAFGILMRSAGVEPNGATTFMSIPCSASIF